MPSLLPGFEYDIFISYRQKDNKGDQWVTQFVHALRTEIESTFKEDITIYFDENPHDGLHAHHDVNDSLREKVKCLVFIPIISRTYCDPNSFAWVHEFMAFLNQARSDSFGLKVKAQNGNVTSRILPVRIHDLPPDDVKLYETETGGVLRSIDFTFKGPGINRPLQPSDKKEDNASHTSYRDQINKVANALEEVISGMRNHQGKVTDQSAPEQSVPEASRPKPIRGNLVSKLMAGGVTGVLLALASWYLLGRGQPEGNYKYDVAVMYLENFTGNERYGDELASLIYINLSADTSLKILPRQKLFDGMKNFTGEAKLPDQAHSTDIALSNQVKTMITGSIHESGDKALIQIELTDLRTGKVSRTVKMEGSLNNIFDLANAVCDRIQVSPVNPEHNVAAITTTSYEAYQHFYKGLDYYYGFQLRQANDEFKEAIRIDSTFAMSYLLLATSINIFSMMDIGSSLEEQQGLIKKGMKYISRLSPIDQATMKAGEAMYAGDFSGVKQIALHLNDPAYDNPYTAWFGWAGCWLDASKQEINIFEKYTLNHPNSGLAHNQFAYTVGESGDANKAMAHIRRYAELEPGNGNPFDSGWEVGMIVDRPLEAEAYLKQLEPLNNVDFAARSVTHFLLTGKPEQLRKFYQITNDNDLRSSPKGSRLQRLLPFQESYPLSYVIEGRYNDATKAYDVLKARLKSQLSEGRQHILEMHAGIAFMGARRLDKALAIFERLSEDAGKANGRYDAVPILSRYYSGMALVRAGQEEKAQIKLKEVEALYQSGRYDWRFGKYIQLLKGEILMNSGKYEEALNSIAGIPAFLDAALMGSLQIKYTCYWKMGQFDKALKILMPFHINVLRYRTIQGGDEALFAWELAFSDYHAGRICEDAGRKADALKYYKTFLEKFKNSDPGIPEKEDARARVKKLETI